VETIYGPVQVDRQRYLCRECNQSFYQQSPLFDPLGQGRISESVWSVAIQFALYAPYEQVSRLLKNTWGMRVSAPRLQQEILKRGLAESQYQGAKAHAQALFADVPEPVPPSRAHGRQYVQMDGCFVHQWRQKANFEIKVGEIYSDPVLTESGRRRWIQHKEYVSFAGNSEAFGERLFSRGEAWHLSQAGDLYLLGDGAAWIKSLWSLYFPHATFLLDWWHVQKAVRRTVSELVPDPDQRTQYHEGILGPLFEGELAKALEHIRQLPDKTEKQRETQRSLMQYLLSNKEGIPNYRVVQEQGIHIGSGVIENACMDAVARRMKHRGMGWTPKGAEALSCLRTLYLNGQWQDYWQQRGIKKAA